MFEENANKQAEKLMSIWLACVTGRWGWAWITLHIHTRMNSYLTIACRKIFDLLSRSRWKTSLFVYGNRNKQKFLRFGFSINSAFVLLLLAGKFCFPV